MLQSVKDITRHILYHANAEARESDPSQVGDVKGRIEYVRLVLAGYELDDRKLEKYTLLREVLTAASISPQRASLRRMLADLEATDYMSPQMAVQEWVARGTESGRL